MTRLKYVIGTLGGVGFLPAAPGTWGSFVSLGLIYPVALTYGLTGILTIILSGAVLTIWASEKCVQRWGEDPPVFVLDELSGQSVVFMFISFGTGLWQDAVILLAGFILFRFFDIIKPLGIKHIQHFPSGFGILLDDLLAGIYALIILEVGLYTISLL